MSKKRTSEEPNNDDETNEDSGYDAAKRARLDLLSDTTLHDLPRELLEDIFVKAVAMEVKGLRLAKSVWNEKADLVINRLRTVSSLWSNILTTDYFRQKTHRTLDGIAQKPIRSEILLESRFTERIRTTTTLKDEIFMLCRVPDTYDDRIIVYNRNDISEVRGVFLPPKPTFIINMAACSISNCLYVAVRDFDIVHERFSVLRVSRTATEETFKSSVFIPDLGSQIFTLFVSPTGSLITRSNEIHVERSQAIVSIHDADGCLQREVKLSPGIGCFIYERVIQKSDGNLILTYVGYRYDGAREKVGVAEIDASGNVVRKYDSPFDFGTVNPADIYGGIMITSSGGSMELLDSEFNLLGSYRLPEDEGKFVNVSAVHYDSERNEVVRVYYDGDPMSNPLTIFRFKEE